MIFAACCVLLGDLDQVSDLEEIEDFDREANLLQVQLNGDRHWADVAVQLPKCLPVGIEMRQTSQRLQKELV